jgi:hypothetical protein
MHFMPKKRSAVADSRSPLRTQSNMVIWNLITIQITSPTSANPTMARYRSNLPTAWNSSSRSHRLSAVSAVTPPLPSHTRHFTFLVSPVPSHSVQGTQRSRQYSSPSALETKPRPAHSRHCERHTPVLPAPRQRGHRTRSSGRKDVCSGTAPAEATETVYQTLESLDFCAGAAHNRTILSECVSLSAFRVSKISGARSTSPL